MINLLKKLIQIESVSGNERSLVEYLAPYLEKIFPGSVSRLDRNIIVDFKFNSAGPTLLMCSHIDTVAPSTGWTKDPFGAEQEGEKIFGLGANDALASVVSIIKAAEKIKEKKLSGRLLLAFVCEEEKGSSGFVEIESRLPRYNFGIFGEPTEMKVGYCMRGSMKLIVRVRGKSSHASRPWEGKNAILGLIEVLQKIKNLPLKDNSPWGQATVEPTRILGGTNDNQIPDLVEIFIDARPTFEINNEIIIEMIKSSGLELEVVRNRRRPMECDRNLPLVKAALAANTKGELYAFGGSCDMAFATAPSIVMGPGRSERSHAADEHILVSELEQAVEIYSRTIETLLT